MIPFSSIAALYDLSGTRTKPIKALRSSISSSEGAGSCYVLRYRMFGSGSCSSPKWLERPLKTGRQDRPEAADAGHRSPERTPARQLCTIAVLLLLHSSSTDLTKARGGGWQLSGSCGWRAVGRTSGLKATTAEEGGLRGRSSPAHCPKCSARRSGERFRLLRRVEYRPRWRS